MSAINTHLFFRNVVENGFRNGQTAESVKFDSCTRIRCVLDQCLQFKDDHRYGQMPGSVRSCKKRYWVFINIFKIKRAKAPAISRSMMAADMKVNPMIVRMDAHDDLNYSNARLIRVSFEPFLLFHVPCPPRT